MSGKVILAALCLWGFGTAALAQALSSSPSPQGDTAARPVNPAFCAGLQRTFDILPKGAGAFPYSQSSDITSESRGSLIPGFASMDYEANNGWYLARYHGPRHADEKAAEGIAARYSGAIRSCYPDLNQEVRRAAAGTLVSFHIGQAPVALGDTIRDLPDFAVSVWPGGSVSLEVKRLTTWYLGVVNQDTEYYSRRFRELGCPVGDEDCVVRKATQG